MVYILNITRNYQSKSIMTHQRSIPWHVSTVSESSVRSSKPTICHKDRTSLSGLLNEHTNSSKGVANQCSIMTKCCKESCDSNLTRDLHNTIDECAFCNNTDACLKWWGDCCCKENAQATTWRGGTVKDHSMANTYMYVCALLLWIRNLA